MPRLFKPFALVLLALVAPFAAGRDDPRWQNEDDDRSRAVQQPALKSADTPVLRSAQGACVSEANRRGFAVLNTSNFRQQRDGWSADLRVRDSGGRVQQGNCYVDTRSGDVDLDGFGWGWNDHGNEGIEFNCSSAQSKYRECQLPVNGQVHLVRRRSDSSCSEGRDWGQRGDRVWVDHGCRARFEVVPGRGHFEGHRGNADSPGGGYYGGHGLGADAAKRACVAEVERAGYEIREAGTPFLSAGDYWLTMKLRSARGDNRTVDCRVDRSSGRVTIGR